MSRQYTFGLKEEDENPQTENPFKLLIPDLTEMAYVGVILSLYSAVVSESETDVMIPQLPNKFNKFRVPYTTVNSPCKSLFRAVHKKISSLTLPKSFVAKLNFLNKLISHELCYLYKLRDPVFRRHPIRWNEIMWTSRGSIDYLATYRKLNAVWY